MDQLILKQIHDLAEEFFQTEIDPTQISATLEDTNKILAIHEKGLIYRTDKDGKLVGWIVVLPTSQKLSLQFLSGEITERMLLEKSEPQNEYDALYLCSAYVVPKHRREGHVVDMLKEAMSCIPHAKDCMLSSWPYSPEGRQLLSKLGGIFGTEIKMKNE